MGEPLVLASSLAVGSSVYCNVNGTKTEFIVVHQDKPSSLYDDSCNGTWLLMKDIYEDRVWQSGDINKYESSDIHTYLNSTFLNLFDSNIKDAIKQVKIRYRKNGGSGGSDQSGANGLPAKIFLLSCYEVGWTTNDNNQFPVAPLPAPRSYQHRVVRPRRRRQQLRQPILPVRHPPAFYYPFNCFDRQ